MLYSELLEMSLDTLWDGKGTRQKGQDASVQLAIRRAGVRTGDPNIIWGLSTDLEEMHMARVGFNTPTMSHYVAKTTGMSIVDAYEPRFIQPYRRRYVRRWLRELKAAGR